MKDHVVNFSTGADGNTKTITHVHRFKNREWREIPITPVRLVAHGRYRVISGTGPKGYVQRLRWPFLVKLFPMQWLWNIRWLWVNEDAVGK